MIDFRPAPTRPGRRAGLPAVLLAVLIPLLALAGCSLPAMGPRITPPTAPNVKGDLTRADVDDWLDGLVPTALQREALPGAVVTVVADGKIVTERGFGAADLGEGDRPPVLVDPARTLFRVGSVSKLVTATAVMQQVQAGKLDLDADIQGYLDFELRKTFDEPVTLRHLLSHSAGYEDRNRGVILPEGTPEPDLRTEVSVDQPEQIYRPGTVPAYSNWSNSLAAYIVQRVAGMPYADYARAQVLDRAGMTESTFAQPLPAADASRLARGYRSIGTPPIGFEVLGPAPAGALSATGHDLGLFMLSLLGRPAGDAPALLRPESLQTMQQPALGPESLGGLAGADQMGVGFFLLEHRGQQIAAHGGDTGVFHSQLALLPEHGTGIFVSVNGNGRAPDGTATLRTTLVEQFVERYHPSAAQPTPPATASSAEHAARAAGAYLISRRSDSSFLRLSTAIQQLRVTDNGDGTISLPALATSGGHPLRLQEIEATDELWLWQEIGGDRRLAMDIDNGQVAAIGMDPAHVLLPAAPAWRAVLPVVIFAVGWAALILIAWPIGAIVRRRHGVDLGSWSAARRRLRTLTHLGLLTIPLALLGWFTVTTLIGLTLPVADGVIRAVQVITVLPVLALVPAVGQVIGTIRHRGGVFGTIANLLIVLALLAFGWAAWQAGLYSLDLTY
ncbi:serine hydrolase domain-containing protein [Microlunatus speluncae]|uniref:serine hydrolase domain-containing protein n=1 Tax=Microlunatus speluncae TaxID=2594267 RepID=UPI00126634F6|nr:serine hydrolase domain-containing protein [Microlunatus speluncae]